MIQNYLLTLEESAKVSGRPVKWLKLRLMDGTLKGNFRDEQWMVSTHALATVCGELSLEGIALGPDRVAGENSDKVVQKSLPDTNNHPKRNVRGSLDYVSKQQSSSKSKKPTPPATETEKIKARMERLEKRKRKLKLDLEDYDRQEKRKGKKHSPPGLKRKQRAAFAEYERVRFELIRLSDELKSKTGIFAQRAKQRPVSRGISGYYVPGLLSEKRFLSNDEDAPR